MAQDEPLSPSGDTDVAETRDDLGADLRAAFDAEEAKETAPLTDDQPEPEVQAKDVRPRDEQGRFVTKPVETPSTEQTADSQPATSQTTQPEQPAQGLPWNWSADAKAEFAKLPKEFQSIALRRAQEIEQLGAQLKTEYDTKLNHIRDIEQTLAPYREKWALEGVSPAQAVNQLIAFHNALQRDPVSALQWAAQQNGVDLAQIANAPRQPADPVAQQLRAELDELRSWREQQSYSAQHQAHSAAQNEINAFASEIDNSGKALRPYFQQVYSDMLPIVSAMRAQDPSKPHRIILQEAYERASWANPEVRAAILREQEAKRVEEEKAKAQAARKAAVSLNGAPGPGLTQTMPGDLRGMLEAAFDRYN